MRPTKRLIPLVVICIVLAAVASILGLTITPSSEFADAHGIFWTIRVPRTCLAICVGAGLAIGGVVFQALFRNPLATPYTLGIASGAAVAAAGGYLLNLAGRAAAGLPVITILAFAGALLSMALVYGLARLRGGQDMTRLLLAGVCISYMSGAGVLLISFLSKRGVTNDIVIWTMGSLDRANWVPIRTISVAVLLVLVFLIYSHRALDLLSLGEDIAASRGVNVGATIWGSYLAIGLLTAVIVASCGPIGFVGLIVPHLARALIGARTLPLLIASAALGAAFLSVCDGAARALLPLTTGQMLELPVGVITSILGAAFFFYLLATRDVSYAQSR